MTASPSAAYHDWKVEQRRRAQPFDVENWYSALQPVTFHTEFLDLSPLEAEAIVAQYRYLFLEHERPADAEGCLERLIERLDSVLLGTEAFRTHGAFVRLSSRSPKDAAPVSHEDMERLTAEYERQIQIPSELAGFDGPAAGGVAGGHAPRDEVAVDRDDYRTNARYRALFDLTWAGLCVRRGWEAIRLLSTSERTVVDLLEALEARELYSMRLVLRAWQPGLRHDREFRGFVSKRNLVALSQYNHYLYLPDVAADAPAIGSRLREFFAQHVRSRVPHDDYVVDFALLADGTVAVVELNPADAHTGPALFDWVRDERLLCGGGGPAGDAFEMRMMPRPLHALQPMVAEAQRQAEEQAAVWARCFVPGSGVARWPATRTLLAGSGADRAGAAASDRSDAAAAPCAVRDGGKDGSGRDGGPSTSRAVRCALL